MIVWSFAGPARAFDHQVRRAYPLSNAPTRCRAWGRISRAARKRSENLPAPRKLLQSLPGGHAAGWSYLPTASGGGLQACLRHLAREELDARFGQLSLAT